jgi:hypothetical protein
VWATQIGTQNRAQLGSQLAVLLARTAANQQGGAACDAGTSERRHTGFAWLQGQAGIAAWSRGRGAGWDHPCHALISVVASPPPPQVLIISCLMTLLQKAGSVYTSKDWGEGQGHGCAWVAACCRWHAEPMHPQHVNLLLLGANRPTQKCTHGMNEGCVHAPAVASRTPTCDISLRPVARHRWRQHQ